MLIKYEKGELDEFSISVWGQAGEDFVLEKIFNNQEKGFYIDIGAHHPDRLSVTKRFYLKGWTGINIDGDATLIKNFVSRRKLDKNITGIVGQKSNYLFYEFKEKALSTVNKSRALELISNGRKLIETRYIQGITLRKIFERVPEGTVIDFMNLDIEGNELDALKSAEFEKMTFDKLPNWILIETRPPLESSLQDESVRYLVEIGYIPYLVLAMNTLLKKPTLSKFNNQIIK